MLYPKPNDGTLVTRHDKVVDREPLVECVTSPVPKYTPMRIPDRVSSAKGEKNGSRRGQRGNANNSNGCLKHSGDTDGLSFKLTGLEEDSDGSKAQTSLQQESQGRGRPRYALYPPR